MTGVRTPAALAVLVVSTMTSLVMAQNPKPPTPLPAEIQSVDQLPQDAVVLWIDGQNLTIYVDSTSNSQDQGKLTYFELKWIGQGPGFTVAECGPPPHTGVLPLKVCPRSISRISFRWGFGPVYDFGDIIPDGYLETWSPAESWIQDGSYLTGGTLDKFDPNSPYFGPVVPEPSSVAIGVLGAVGLLLFRRRL